MMRVIANQFEPSSPERPVRCIDKSPYPTKLRTMGEAKMNQEALTEQKLESALRACLSGSAMLFVGAGTSQLVQNQLGTNVPNGNHLSDLIHDAVSIERRKHSLPAISGYYKKKLGSAKLKQMLEENLISDKISPKLSEFYKKNWRRIYTTNYDDAIEKSRKLGGSISSFTFTEAVRAVPMGAIVHLNGDIKKAFGTNIDDEITLTDQSYAVTNLSDTDWKNLFISDLKIAKAVFFVGYSISDLDIARILIAEPSISAKTFIFVGPDTDEVEMSRIEKFGYVFKEGTDFLFEKLSAAEENFSPPTVSESLFHAVELDLENYLVDGTAAQTVFDQLVYGKLPTQAFLSGAIALGETSYLVDRTDASQVCSRLNQGTVRDVFVTGDIASGKTTALLQIARDLIQTGHQVYWINLGRHIDRDFDLICKNAGPVAVIIDGYADCFDSLRRYLNTRPSSHVAILAERTATHEIFRRSLDSDSNFGPDFEVSLNRVDEREARHFDELMNFAGLWGDLAGLSKQRRVRHITHDQSGVLYRLLIEIIKSKKVQDEIRNLLNPILKDEHAHRFFVTAFIVNVLGYNFWINDWQYFYSINDIRKTISEHNRSLSHFINTDAAQINLRSGILSGHILRNFTDDEMVLDCLVDMYDCATRNSFNDDEFSKIAFELRLYNKIEPMFDDKRKLQYLKKYYQEIRQFGKTENNSDYWLQFGIAMSIHGDLNEAHNAFTNEYSREKSKNNPNTTKIDNYYARFELERAIDLDDKDAAYQLTRSGANKLMKQTFMDNNRHYPFKTGRSFSDIAAKHYDKWDADQQNAFRKICFDIRDRARQWIKANKAENRDVNFLINDIDKLEGIFEESSPDA